MRPVMLVLGIGSLAVSLALPPEQPVKAVGSVQQLMDAMVIPASNAIFDVARQAPFDDAEWVRIEHSSVVLAESGNLLMLGERAESSDVWMGSSRALVDAGEQALAAATLRDVDALIDVGNQVMEACETCHATYLDTSP